MKVTGRCSWFGGPNDHGVRPSEGLAFIYSYSDAPHLFLDKQPRGTQGLARRLNPDVYYVACRWDYNSTPKRLLARKDLRALVSAGGKELLAWPADWGPNKSTGRVADLSPSLMKDLGISTGDTVTVIYPSETKEIDMPTPVVIDLSHHNSISSSLKAAKAAGILGIIHKLTEGTGFVDSKAAARYFLAGEADMLWGLYHFARPGDPKKQADFFVKKAQELKIADEGTLYVLDHEDTGFSVDDAVEFLRRVEELTGQQPVIYSGHVLKEQLKTKANPDIIKYRLWLAQYGSKAELPKGFTEWWLWQYTENGTCEGISPPVDLNAYSGDDLANDWSGTPRDETVASTEPEEEKLIVTVTISAPPNVSIEVITQEK